MRSLAVQSHRGTYLVRRTALRAALPSGLLPGDRLIVDRAVQHLHPVVSDIGPVDQVCSVKANESLKSLEGATQILSWLHDSGFNRAGTLYVVGGGTVQDVACFVASIFHRGVRWVFAPTTLISQGDSCIGSKSSINHGGYKNQLGTFYPPKEVIVDHSFLATLPTAHVRSGVGEILHYAVLGEESEFAAFEARVRAGWRTWNADDLTELAMSALAVKRRFVEADEFDAGERKVLNLGHTFGHALESASAGAIPHGVAVAYGIGVAAAYSESLGILEPPARVRLNGVVRELVDGGELATVSGKRLFEGITRDKKRSDATVELVLIEGIGKPVLREVPLDARLRSFLDHYLAGWARGSQSALDRV